MSPVTAFLGLGSNLGDRAAALEQALTRLELRELRIIQRSSLYLTEPVGGPAQPWFLNMVVEAQTGLDAEALLATCLDVETEMGRARSAQRWGPRPIDIDVLLYDAVVAETPALTLPHPRLHERRFVLEPLVEIAPELQHPRLGVSIAELRAACADTSRVTRRSMEDER